MENEKGIKAQIKVVRDLCRTYLAYVNRIGNECAYTDTVIDRIVSETKTLEKMQKARGL